VVLVNFNLNIGKKQLWVLTKGCVRVVIIIHVRDKSHKKSGECMLKGISAIVLAVACLVVFFDQLAERLRLPREDLAPNAVFLFSLMVAEFGFVYAAWENLSQS